jgi:tetratricopeptide (TPR) repeat protein
MKATAIFYTPLLFLCLALGFARAQDPLSSTAEYYFSRQDYQQALNLWLEVLKRHPQNVDALLRIGELRLHFEGREALRTTLYDFVEKYKSQLNPDTLERIQTRWRELQTAFLTDQGQERYLQAVERLKRKDYEGARDFLVQAHGLEKGNIKILVDKAKCEKALGSFQEFYATLKEANKNDPFDALLRDDLIEAQIYFKDFNEVVKLTGGTPSSPRQSVGVGVALMKVGENQKALKILQGMAESGKDKAVHPIVFFAVGNILSHTPNSRGEALSYQFPWLKLGYARGDVLALKGKWRRAPLKARARL